MSRPIEFRAWNIKEKRMIENIQQEYDGTEEDCFAEYLAQESNHGRNGIEGKYEVMQYTGLKDKNGVKIFEGDIVKAISNTDQANMLVEWEEGKFVLKIEGNGLSYKDLKWLQKEVIGNIYQNQELLEKTK